MSLVAFSQLKLFKDIAQNRSVSRGAAANGISQSAASQQIQELEKSMDVMLFDRTTRPLTLTPAGRLYFDLCRDVLRRNEDFMVVLGQLRKDEGGAVRVASIYSVGIADMARLEADFAAQFPDARLQVEYLRPEKVLEAVLTEHADLGLISYPEASKEIAVVPWRNEEMVVAAAPAHPLACRERISPRDLEGLEFIGFDEDLPIAQEVDRFLRGQGAQVHRVMHFDVIQMVKEAVALGPAVSIVPRRILQAEIEQGRLVAITLEPGLVRPVGIIHRRRKKFNRATESFLKLLLETHEAPATLLSS
jgi:LysR family transcriptional regulator, transcriptional activator of the cysJI operon